jgi:hypothetical protein
MNRGIAAVAIFRFVGKLCLISAFLIIILQWRPLCSSYPARRSNHLAEGIYYLLIGTCLIVGSVLLRRATSGVQRHRDSHGMERGVAEHLNQVAAEKIT